MQPPQDWSKDTSARRQSPKKSAGPLLAARRALRVCGQERPHELTPRLPCPCIDRLARTGGTRRPRNHAAHRDDGLRYPASDWNAEQWLRGHALPRLSDLRGAGAVGSDKLSLARRLAAGPCGKMGAGQGRQEDLDLSPA